MKTYTINNVSFLGRDLSGNEILMAKQYDNKTHLYLCADKDALTDLAFRTDGNRNSDLILHISGTVDQFSDLIKENDSEYRETTWIDEKDLEDLRDEFGDEVLYRCDYINKYSYTDEEITPFEAACAFLEFNNDTLYIGTEEIMEFLQELGVTASVWELFELSQAGQTEPPVFQEEDFGPFELPKVLYQIDGCDNYSDSDYIERVNNSLFDDGAEANCLSPDASFWLYDKIDENTGIYCSDYGSYYIFTTIYENDFATLQYAYGPEDSLEEIIKEYNEDNEDND